MKKILLSLLLPVLLITGCAAKGSKNSEAKSLPFTEIKGDTVYDSSGNEILITGKVVVKNDYVTFPVMDLGLIENGKLNLVFPDITLARGDENFLTFSRIKESFPPGLSITPEDTSWVSFDDSISFLVLTDEEIPSIADPDPQALTDEEIPDITDSQSTDTQSIEKLYYTLELVDLSGEYEVWFAFFIADVTIKGKGTYFGFREYDVDITAARGWNKIYVNNSETGVTMRTSTRDIPDMQWVVSETSINLSRFWF